MPESAKPLISSWQKMKGIPGKSGAIKFPISLSRWETQPLQEPKRNAIIAVGNWWTFANPAVSKHATDDFLLIPRYCCAPDPQGHIGFPPFITAYTEVWIYPIHAVEALYGIPTSCQEHFRKMPDAEVQLIFERI